MPYLSEAIDQQKEYYKKLTEVKVCPTTATKTS